MMTRNKWLTLTVLFLCWSDRSSAICFETNYLFKPNGTKEENVKTILDFGKCIKNEQRMRVGKWLCYVSAMVGIQKQDNDNTFAGQIRAKDEKFFITISEISDHSK